MSTPPTASPTVQVQSLYDGAVVVQPSPVHFRVVTARRANGSVFVVRVTQDALQ